MRQPAVSVVMATHQRAQMLKKALASLERQIVSVPFEAVIVDNSSTDDTRRILEDFTDRHPWARALHEPRLGKSRALNTGVASARGRVLVFTDDDVVADPGWIEAYISFFDSHPGRILAGGKIVPITSDGGPWPWWFTPGCMEDVPSQVDHGSTRPLLQPFEYVWGANLAMSRDTFDRFGPWNEGTGAHGAYAGGFPKPRRTPAEDIDLNGRVRAGGGEIWFVREAVINHRVRRGEVTPRRLMVTAYGRGASEYTYWRRFGAYWAIPAVSARLHNGPVRRIGLLIGHLAVWTAAAVAFRIGRRPRAFDLARRRATTSSWIVAAISECDPWLDLLATKVARAVRRVCLRLVTIE
jgi:glucosyl-dolichyl phosphate glucuronosyltransferase